MNGIFNDDEKKSLQEFMDYLKTLNNDDLLWLMLCVAAESKRRQEEHERS